MGEIADMMLEGALCAGCGVSLDCEDCGDSGMPTYCTKKCAKDFDMDPEYCVCNH